MCTFIQSLLQALGSSLKFEDAFEDYMATLQEDKVDEIIETIENHEIKEASIMSIVEDREYKESMDGGPSHDLFEE